MSAAESHAPTRVPERADGRDARWEHHRKERRRELVDAALRAIRAHGPSVGMDEISATAGTSKTVIYRHLGDRLGLYLAVCEAVDARILTDFQRALNDIPGTDDPADPSNDDPRRAVVAVTDSYLRLVERDPEVYRFVTRRPLADMPAEQDPVSGLSNTIAVALATLLERFLKARGLDPSAAPIWAHALVGAVRESADRWLVSPDRQPREVVVNQLADLAAFGLAGVLRTPASPDPRSSIEHL